MAQQANVIRTAVVTLRGIQFNITSINDRTKISDLKRKIKKHAERFMIDFDADDMEDCNLLIRVDGTRSIKDDNKLIMPLFEGDRLNVTVEEPIAVILKNPNQNTRFGIYVFPSDPMEEVYAKAVNLDCTEGIWFHLDRSNSIYSNANSDYLHKSAVISETLRDREELKVTNYHQEAPNRQISIRTSRERTFQLNVSDELTVRDIKWMIRCRDGIPMAKQRLLFRGRELNDAHELFWDENVQDGSTLILTCRV